MWLDINTTFKCGFISSGFDEACLSMPKMIPDSESMSSQMIPDNDSVSSQELVEL